VTLSRPALVLAALGLAASGVPALAADAPKTSATSSSFFLVQDGCGAETGPGRLEVKKLQSDAPGCGTIGGLPFDEVFAQTGAIEPTSFDTVGKGLPIVLDASRKVTGQLTGSAWLGVGAGGAGVVQFDVAATARTASGSTVDFGSTSVSGMGAPGQDEVQVPFELTVPSTANGQRITSISLLVLQRGLNTSYSATAYGGESYVVLPTKAPGKKK
jgi:hypothetical protein